LKKFLSVSLTLLLLLTLAVSALAEETEGESNAEFSAQGGPEDTPQIPESEPDPVPDIPETLAEDSTKAPASDIESPSPDPDIPADVSVPDNLGTPAYDMTEMPAGDVIIEEHIYTRTVDIAGALDALDLSDLTMHSALTAVLGEYKSKTQIISAYCNGQLLDTSTEYVPDVTETDMEWIAGAIIFIVLLYCPIKL